MKKLAMILAISKNGIIGNNSPGEKPIPWLGDIPCDMKFFREKTTGNKNNAVAMGSVTKETIDLKYFPLKDRKNIILTRNKGYVVPDGVEKLHSIAALMEYYHNNDFDTLWIAGGLDIYRQMFVQKELSEVYVTRVHEEFEGDVYYPELNDISQSDWKLFHAAAHYADEKNMHSVTWETWVRK
jgi:dihydrofolate reductase